MLSNARILACVLLFVAALPASVRGQGEFVQLQTRNPSFESGIDGWDYTPIASEILTRDFEFDATEVRELQAGLGKKLVRLRGNGVWGQTIFFGPSVRFQILNAFVCKRPTSGSGPAGFAELGVTYYDALGNELDTINVEVPDADPELNRGVGDGLSFKSWGIKVPPNAFRAFVFAYTSEGTDVYLDGFGLFQIANTGSTPIITKNLLMNSGFLSNHFMLGGPVCQGYGNEFWETEIDWLDGFNGTFGSPNQAELAYQDFTVTGGAAYSLLVTGSKINQGTLPASVGVDFFDASWNRVGQVAVNLYGTKSAFNVGKRIVAPASAVHASVWIWCDKLTSNFNFQMAAFPSFYLQQSTASTATTTIMTDASVSFLKTGREGAVTVVYSDPDGIDVSTLDLQDGVFKSKTNAATSYPISNLNVTSLDGGRLVRVRYSVIGIDLSDVGSFVLNANQIKDKKGNIMPTKVFSPIVY